MELPPKRTSAPRTERWSWDGVEGEGLGGLEENQFCHLVQRTSGKNTY